MFIGFGGIAVEKKMAQWAAIFFYVSVQYPIAANEVLPY